ncbi:MAG: DUF2384 domain-containing protein [Nitrospirae bacterium]|nr:DUF2384 domain-containing protein [Nitrospirota bacterium]
MDNHYQKWFNDRILALDNKTPLDAIKTKEGKRKVIELLKLYENVEELKKKARPYYDIGLSASLSQKRGMMFYNYEWRIIQKRF